MEVKGGNIFSFPLFPLFPFLQLFFSSGDMVLRVSDPAKAAIKIILPEIEDKTIQFKTHPNVDKKLWSTDFAIGLKDATRPFPLNQPVGVLKWRMQTKDESCVPLLSTGLSSSFLLLARSQRPSPPPAVNCWPSPSGDGSCDVNIEYELTKEIELKDVIISIPVPQRFACPLFIFWGMNLPQDPQCQFLFFFFQWKGTGCVVCGW